jgi:hypothetical protein
VVSNAFEVIDTIDDEYGDTCMISRVGDRVHITLEEGVSTISFDAERRDRFAKAWAEAERRAEASAELLDRAAMPGQVT